MDITNNNTISWYMLEDSEYCTSHITKRIFNSYYQIDKNKKSDIFKIYFYDNHYYLIDETKDLDEAKKIVFHHFETTVKEYLSAKSNKNIVNSLPK